MPTRYLTTNELQKWILLCYEQQRLRYLHENPVRAGLVRESQQWLYSSGIDYYVHNGKELSDLVRLD